jgi:transposase
MKEAKKPPRLPRKAAQLLVRELFLAGRTRKDIAELVGYSERAVGGWVDEMGLEQVRKRMSTAPRMLAERMLAELEELEATIHAREPGSRFATAKEADARRKILASIKDLNAGMTLSQYVDFCLELNQYIRAHHPDESERVTELLDGFVKRKAQELEAQA